MRKINNFLSDVKDYYFITKDGDVISRARTKEIVLRPSLKPNGYLQVSLVKNDGSIKYVSIHRLVAMAFISNYNSLSQVNHIDGNKQNNCVDNLEWVSSKDNIRHAWKTKLAHSRNGEQINFASITEEQAEAVIELLRTQQYTDKEIELLTGCNAKSIVSRIRRKETWKHLTRNDGVLGKSQKRK